MKALREMVKIVVEDHPALRCNATVWPPSCTSTGSPPPRGVSRVKRFQLRFEFLEDVQATQFKRRRQFFIGDLERSGQKQTFLDSLGLAHRFQGAIDAL